MRKKIKFIIYIFAFLGLLVVSLLWLMPLSIVNTTFFPHYIRLTEPHGNIHKGSWKNIDIHEKQYPLSCVYERTKIGFSGIEYFIDCNIPLQVTGSAKINFIGEINLENVTVTGDIGDTASWQRFFGIPVIISGPLTSTISKLTVNQQMLSHFDIAGVVKQLNVMYIPLLKNLSVETINSSIVENQPIVIEVRTKNFNQQASNKGFGSKERIQLYLKTEIDGPNYHTTGEISGKGVTKYTNILRFLGQQRASDRFAINMKGELF